MVIFNSYVSLPEGNDGVVTCNNHSHALMGITMGITMVNYKSYDYYS